MAREIIPGTSQLLETCGRSSAASGTEGTLERVEVGPWNSYGGALGNVDVEISRKRA
ncbi:hypothetical protein BDV35DRAFT_342495 [Aspergillus flavus]|uniref:Uncharacterized protein n=1 Tax=Aspergillus flavus TaxID=5059 RepID=A0A5N6H7L4_ASPFL|nr:hypothetical protein BDV35DRAFT_342495 [Aspergillus flavus]